MQSLYCIAQRRHFQSLECLMIIIVMEHVLQTEFANITDDIICVIELQNCVVYGSGWL